MDYEFDDDRPTERDDEQQNGEQPASPGLFADEFVFEAPDLATAFLAALDAVDDRRFVTPPPDPPPTDTITAEPVASEPVAADAAAAAEPAAETVPAEAVAAEPVIEAAAAAHADESSSDRAIAEAFAREQAALALWGTDSNDSPEPTEPTESAESTGSAESIESTESESQAEIVAETVSNADSYYDPDTLRLARPLFSPDEPRAFVSPVHVGQAGTADGDAAGTDAEVLEDLEEFVAFSLGETRCVVPIRNVIEIGRIPSAVAVPNAPAWLHGLGNLRGQVLSLIDLRAFLGIGRVRPATGRMLVLRADDDEAEAGVLVDHVHQIVSLSASRFHGVPETLPHHYARHAWGVCEYGNYTMIGLDVDSLLGVESLMLEEAAEAV